MLDETFTRSDLDHERHLDTDAELEALVRDRVETVYHPTSTCRMAPQADGGVVDSKLRVYGVDGLRVADASIFPWIVSGHTVGDFLHWALCFSCSFYSFYRLELALPWQRSWRMRSSSSTSNIA